MNNAPVLLHRGDFRLPLWGRWLRKAETEEVSRPAAGHLLLYENSII